jgi:hypothetical protein
VCRDEHIVECWRDESGRAITRGRDAKRWEARFRLQEKDLVAAKTAHADVTAELGKRSRELEATRAEAAAKIAEQGATIESQHEEVTELMRQIDRERRERTRRRRR